MLYQLIYLTVSILGLLALAKVILTIGSALAECPQTGPAARAGTLSITAGFVAMGLGVIALGGAWVTGAPSIGIVPVYLALGVVALLLGLGFTQAALSLRKLVLDMTGDAAAVAQAEEPVTAGTEAAEVPA